MKTQKEKKESELIPGSLLKVKDICNIAGEICDTEGVVLGKACDLLYNGNRPYFQGTVVVKLLGEGIALPLSDKDGITHRDWVLVRFVPSDYELLCTYPRDEVS